MAYTKVNWQADTLLTPARFRQMETQYDEVKSYWVTNPFRMENEPLVAEVLSTAPTHGAGRLYQNSTDGKLYVSDGAAWIDLTEGL